MKNQIDDVLNSKIGKKQFLIPLITIIAFVLVIGGVSYAYFGFTSVTNNVIYANVSTPEAVNKSLSITKTDCAMDISMNSMKSDSDSYLGGTTDACTLNIIMTGAPGDYCTYNLILDSIGNTYTPSISVPNKLYDISDDEFDSSDYEFLTQISFHGYEYSHDAFSALGWTDIDIFGDYYLNGNLDKFILQSNLAYNNNGRIEIPDSTEVYWNGEEDIESPVDTIEHHYNMDLSFYNLPDVDQTQMIKSTTAPTVYKYQLKVTDLDCNWNH